MILSFMMSARSAAGLQLPVQKEIHELCGALGRVSLKHLDIHALKHLVCMLAHSSGNNDVAGE